MSKEPIYELTHDEEGGNLDIKIRNAEYGFGFLVKRLVTGAVAREQRKGKSDVDIPKYKNEDGSDMEPIDPYILRKYKHAGKTVREVLREEGIDGMNYLANLLYSNAEPYPIHFANSVIFELAINIDEMIEKCDSYSERKDFLIELINLLRSICWYPNVTYAYFSSLGYRTEYHMFKSRDRSDIEFVLEEVANHLKEDIILCEIDEQMDDDEADVWNKNVENQDD